MTVRQLVGLAVFLFLGIIVVRNTPTKADQSELFRKVDDLKDQVKEPAGAVQLWRVVDLPPGEYEVIARLAPPNVAWVKFHPEYTASVPLTKQFVHLVEDVPINTDKFVKTGDFAK